MLILAVHATSIIREGYYFVQTIKLQNWRMDEIITTVSSEKKNQNTITKITSHECCDVISSQKTCYDITSQSNKKITSQS